MSDTEIDSRRAPEDPAPASRPEPMSTILAVHDDQRVHALLRNLVEDPRGQVVEVADIDTGIVLAQTLRPNCLLIAAGLPRRHRDALLDGLRRDPRTRRIPVIVLDTEEGSPEGVERAIGEGATDYIGAPASAAIVAARVRGAMQRAHLPRDLGDVRADLLAMLVHDLRTPLTVIQGYLDLLEGGPGTAREVQARYLHNMQACCTQMVGLVTEILDLYQLDAGRIVGELRPVDLAAFVASVVGRFAPAAAQRGIALAISGTERPLQVLGDAGRLDQVLMDLLGSALKFTPQGGSVTASIRPVEMEVEVAETDSGPGISAEEISLLFERFGQRGQGQRSRGAGTSLGLLICRRIIEAHGGRIWIESGTEGGVRVIFRLVRISDPASDEAHWSEF